MLLWAGADRGHHGLGHHAAQRGAPKTRNGGAQLTRASSIRLTVAAAQVAHETQDASREPARDGTISWIHGMRFLGGALDMSEVGVPLLCKEARPASFHPSMFEPLWETNCSLYTMWNKCWERECLQTVQKHRGCHRRGDCETKFRTTLLQVTAARTASCRQPHTAVCACACRCGTHCE